MAETDLTASATRARDSLGSGVSDRLQAVRPHPQGKFYGNIGQV